MARTPPRRACRRRPPDASAPCRRSAGAGTARARPRGSPGRTCHRSRSVRTPAAAEARLRPRPRLRVVRPAGEHDGGVRARARAGGGLGKALRGPLLDRAAARRVQRQQRCRETSRRPVARATPAPTPRARSGSTMRAASSAAAAGGAGTRAGGQVEAALDERRAGWRRRGASRRTARRLSAVARRPPSRSRRGASPPPSTAAACRADVALEVDREVVVPAAPARCPSQQAADGARQAVPRASHGASSTSTVFTGSSRASASFQLPTTEIDRRRPARGAAGLRRSRPGHQQIADALEPQQEHAARRGAGTRGHEPSRQGRDAEREVRQANQQALTSGLDVQIVEHRGVQRAAPTRRTSTRSTITPRSRLSSAPVSARGFHVVLISRTVTESTLAAACAASAGGISKA